MVIMLAVVSVAIGVFMIRHKSSSMFHAGVIFVVGVMLIVCMIVVTIEFSVLTGITGIAAIIIPGCFWGFILLGAGLALWAKYQRPNIYAKLGRDEGERV